MPKVTFITATQARNNSRNNITIHNEIRDIENKILLNIDDGFYECVVNNTTMTNNIDCWKVLNFLIEDRVISEQLDIVKQNFIDLGYNIRTRTNANNINGNTFEWVILW